MWGCCYAYIQYGFSDSSQRWYKRWFWEARHSNVWDD